MGRPSPLLLAVLLAGCGSLHLDDRTTAPALPATALEVVANLDFPPGNIAVSATGRVFFTFHPDGDPSFQLAELVDGRPVPYPDAAFQHERSDGLYFQSVLALRIDRQNFEKPFASRIGNVDRDVDRRTIARILHVESNRLHAGKSKRAENLVHGRRRAEQ